MALEDSAARGHRCVHHELYGEIDQRAQALLYRDHHEEDGHTHDEDYAAIDEALTRLDALERPDPAKRLDLLRKLARARLIRRQSNKEANWLVANNEYRGHRWLARRHEKNPSKAHPGYDGYELRPEDKLRIGPNRSDVDAHCDRLVDELRPRTIELLAHQAAGRDGAAAAVIQRAAVIDRLRARAMLLKALADQPDAQVRDDWFEPKHWSAGHSDDLRAYVRLSQLGTPESEADKWHAVATAAMAGSGDDNDLLAICAVVTAARTASKTYPLWPAPPSDLPAVTVTGSGNRVTLTWTGTLPAGVKVIATAAVASGLAVTHEASEDDLPGSLGNINFPSPASGRCAVLVQHQKDVERKASARSAGRIHVVNVT